MIRGDFRFSLLFVVILAMTHFFQSWTLHALQLYPERFVLDVLFVESQYFAMFVTVLFLVSLLF